MTPSSLSPLESLLSNEYRTPTLVDPSISEQDMGVYFIRHGKVVDVDEETQKKLWNNHLVGFHFPTDNVDKTQDSARTDRESYKGTKGEKAVNALNNLAENGGFVFSTHHLDGGRFMLGFVEPGSKITITTGTRDNKSIARLKTLALTRVCFIQRSDMAYGVLKAKMGIFGTIHRANNAGIVRNLVNRTEPEAIFENLEPAQQEIMCSEALRLSPLPGSRLPQMKHLLSRTGGSMAAVDIWGVGADGRLVAAQVTYSDSPDTIARKHQALKEWGATTNAHLILFCNVKEEMSEDMVLKVPIQEVFTRFAGTATGMQWLHISLGLQVLEPAPAASV